MYLGHQGTKWTSVALIAVLCEGCATATGEKPSLFQIAQQALGAASMVVGVASGDSSLAESGAQVFVSGRGLDSTWSSSTSAESYSDSPTQLAQANPDLQAMAERCRENADRQIPNANQQNTILKYQACIAWCGYKATNSEQYFRIYSQSQAGANELCGRGANSNCNDIRKEACAG